MLELRGAADADWRTWLSFCRIIGFANVDSVNDAFGFVSDCLID